MRQSTSWILLSVVIGVAAWMGHPKAQGPATVFVGIGDLPGTGGISSAVRDATRVSGTILRGRSLDSQLDGKPACPRHAGVVDVPRGGASGTLQALPYDIGVSNTNASDRSAYAITPGGSFIASQSQP